MGALFLQLLIGVTVAVSLFLSIVVLCNKKEDSADQSLRMDQDLFAVIKEKLKIVSNSLESRTKEVNDSDKELVRLKAIHNLFREAKALQKMMGNYCKGEQHYKQFFKVDLKPMEVAVEQMKEITVWNSEEMDILVEWNLLITQEEKNKNFIRLGLHMMKYFQELEASVHKYHQKKTKKFGLDKEFDSTVFSQHENFDDVFKEMTNMVALDHNPFNELEKAKQVLELTDKLRNAVVKHTMGEEGKTYETKEKQQQHIVISAYNAFARKFENFMNDGALTRNMYGQFNLASFDQKLSEMDDKESNKDIGESSLMMLNKDDFLLPVQQLLKVYYHLQLPQMDVLKIRGIDHMVLTLGLIEYDFDFQGPNRQKFKEHLDDITSECSPKKASPIADFAILKQKSDSMVQWLKHRFLEASMPQRHEISKADYIPPFAANPHGFGAIETIASPSGMFVDLKEADRIYYLMVQHGWDVSSYNEKRGRVCRTFVWNFLCDLFNGKCPREEQLSANFLHLDRNSQLGSVFRTNFFSKKANHRFPIIENDVDKESKCVLKQLKVLFKLDEIEISKEKQDKMFPLRIVYHPGKYYQKRQQKQNNGKQKIVLDQVFRDEQQLEEVFFASGEDKKVRHFTAQLMVYSCKVQRKEDVIYVKELRVADRTEPTPNYLNIKINGYWIEDQSVYDLDLAENEELSMRFSKWMYDSNGKLSFRDDHFAMAVIGVQKMMGHYCKGEQHYKQFFKLNLHPLEHATADMNNKLHMEWIKNAKEIMDFSKKIEVSLHEYHSKRKVLGLDKEIDTNVEKHQENFDKGLKEMAKLVNQEHNPFEELLKAQQLFELARKLWNAIVEYTQKEESKTPKSKEEKEVVILAYNLFARKLDLFMDNGALSRNMYGQFNLDSIDQKLSEMGDKKAKIDESSLLDKSFLSMVRQLLNMYYQLKLPPMDVLKIRNTRTATNHLVLALGLIEYDLKSMPAGPFRQKFKEHVDEYTSECSPKKAIPIASIAATVKSEGNKFGPLSSSAVMGQWLNKGWRSAGTKEADQMQAGSPHGSKEFATIASPGLVVDLSEADQIYYQMVQHGWDESSYDKKSGRVCRTFVWNFLCELFNGKCPREEQLPPNFLQLDRESPLGSVFKKNLLNKNGKHRFPIVVETTVKNDACVLMLKQMKFHFKLHGMEITKEKLNSVFPLRIIYRPGKYYEKRQQKKKDKEDESHKEIALEQVFSDEQQLEEEVFVNAEDKAIRHFTAQLMVYSCKVQGKKNVVYVKKMRIAGNHSLLPFLNIQTNGQWMEERLWINPKAMTLLEDDDRWVRNLDLAEHSELSVEFSKETLRKLRQA